MSYSANKPNDLEYLGSRASGFGAWSPDEPMTPLRRSWLDFADHTLEWFHQPDLEALHIHAAVLLSHYLLTELPIWLFIIGESSSGKTALFINPFERLPQANIKSNITPKSFLSGRGGSSSMLTRDGKSSIWLFKDFTSILQMKHEDLKSIMKYLREIYDGKVFNETGADAGKLAWEGKITCCAACTYSLDRAWSIHSELGERFLRLNLRSPNLEGAHYAAMAQVGKQASINQTLQRLAQGWLLNAYRFWESLGTVPHNQFKSFVLPDQPADPETSAMLYSFSLIISRCRMTTDWDFLRKEIVRIGKMELTPRVSRNLWLLMLSHARLFGRTNPTHEDFSIVQRITLDSITEDRRLILSHVPTTGPIQYKALRRSLRGLALRQFKEALEELIAIQILNRRAPPASATEFDDDEIFFTPEFQPHFAKLYSINNLTQNVIPFSKKA